MPLIEFTANGLYCRPGDFYIDPWRPVDKAIITHAHSDHARFGSKHYLCHHDTKPLLRLRLGDNPYQSVAWNEPVFINGVKISLHPAGHIIGSSQVRIEHHGETWVVSGDYKTENDGLSGSFEAVPCHTFITESTFGLPIYNWKTQEEIYKNIKDWVISNKDEGKVPVLIAYSLGKAQRLLTCLADTGLPIFLHGATYNVHMALVNAGWKLPPVHRVDPSMPKETFKGGVVIAPGSADGSPWMKRFSPSAVGVCSGWMQVRGNTRRRNADAGFALSDHADWKGLVQTIRETGASKVYVTHGFQAAFSRYLNELGIEAAEVKTEYGSEDEETQTEDVAKDNAEVGSFSPSPDEKEDTDLISGQNHEQE
jgi:putative mRNA 3-end processing factor